MAYFTFSVWQDGMKVASSGGANEMRARFDAMHYANMYEQDGPVEVRYRNKIVYRTPEVLVSPEP